MYSKRGGGGIILKTEIVVMPQERMLFNFIMYKKSQTFNKIY